MLGRTEDQDTLTRLFQDTPNDLRHTFTVALIPLIGQIQLAHGHELFIVQRGIDFDVLFQGYRSKVSLIDLGIQPSSHLLEIRNSCTHADDLHGLGGRLQTIVVHHFTQ